MGLWLPWNREQWEDSEGIRLEKVGDEVRRTERESQVCPFFQAFSFLFFFELVFSPFGEVVITDVALGVVQFIF